jgi:processive 1,2-diacylglycerol beta-glucosyltransferase
LIVVKLRDFRQTLKKQLTDFLMNNTRRILILTLSFGAGHVSCARALRREFARQLPQGEIRLVDALADCPLWFRFFYVWTYWAMIRFAPVVWDKFFAARVARKDEQTAPVWALRRGFEKVFAEIGDFKPDLIAACEVAACEIAVLARRSKLTTAEIINVITDFEAEPIWVKPEIAAFFVPNKAVAAQLENWNADAAKIKICGIPIHHSFGEKHDASETRKAFGLNKKPLVLLMGGGMGPTRMDLVAAKLLKSSANLQIIALPGKDKTARKRLKRLKSNENVELKIVAWTDKVAALMQTANVLATKPGGVTLAEAAVCGLPLVLFDAIPGPEKTNAADFASAGAAVMANGAQETTRAILDILREDAKRAEMKRQIRRLAQPEAAREIVKIALGINHPPQIKRAATVL